MLNKTGNEITTIITMQHSYIYSWEKNIKNKSTLFLTTVQTLAMLVFAYFTGTGLK